MYPGSFIWKRIDDEWLVSRIASAFFALAAFIIVGMTIVLFTDIESRIFGFMGNVFLGTAGVLAAVSVFFLWGGMWRYWIRCDSSSLTARRVWFMALAVGVWYGAILYYAFVYLSGTRTLGQTRRS